MKTQNPSYEDLQHRIKQLEEKENKELQLLFKSMLNAFVIFDSVFDESGNFVSYRFVYINDAYEEITGVKHKEVKGKTVHEVWPDTEQSWIEKYGHVAVTGETLEFDNYHEPTKKIYHCKVYRPWDSQNRFCVIFDDITTQQQTQNDLKKIEWLLKPKSKEITFGKSAYGDLTTLNTDGLILQNVGEKVLKAIVQDYLTLLDTSAAIYEKNGDYALGIFSSNWCSLLDNASRELCGKCSDADALNSGKWHCHESCWTGVSKKAIETGKTVDEECNGGLRIYTIPIWLNNKVIGAINFGYGSPPTDKDKLEEISNKYKIPYAELLKSAIKYETRPAFIIDIAKMRLQQSARMISEILELKLAEKKIQYQNEEITSQNEELSAQNEEITSTNYKLQVGEQQFRALFEHMPSGVVVYETINGGHDFIIKDFNNSAEKIEKVKRSGIIGKRLTEAFVGVKNFGILKTLKTVWETGKPQYFSDTLYKDGSGVSSWRENWIYKLPSGNLVAVYNEVTLRKLAQLKLEESENKLQKLFDHMNSGFSFHKIVLDENEKPVDYIFMEVNTAFEQMTGLKSTNIIGKKVTEVIPGIENDPANWIGVYGKVALSGKPVKFQNYSIELGKWFSVSAYSPMKGYFASIFEDITNQIKTQEKLKLSEAKYRSYIDHAPHGVFVVDDKGKYLDANPTASKMTGYSIKEILQMKTTDFALSKEENDIAKKRFMKLSKSGSLNKTTQFVKKDGSTGWWHIDAVKISGNKFLGFTTDVTKQKISEEALVKALQQAEESDRLKSAFLANMSHEIRTPMNGILGFADLLKEPDLTGEEQNKYVNIIERSGERMLNIINDLIDISKIEAGQMEVVISETNIREQAEYLHTFFKPEMDKKGLEFITSFPTINPPFVFRTDREKLYAIITNLLKNAIKYTKRGSIEFGYKLMAENNIVLGSAPDGTVVETPVLQFYIKDTGIGIPANRIDAIFERFIQADIEDKNAMEGAGLGLAISKAYVAMLVGQIWVESSEGEGSTFYFAIPDQPFEKKTIALEKTVSSQNIKATQRKLKILVAEDDETSEMHLSILLQDVAKEIYYARSGTEAVSMCENNPDLDLILMDIKMPLLDGYDASREIRKFNSDVIIIAQTAYALSGDREKALDAGCNDYITKPINKEKLIKLIRKNTG